MKLINNGWKWMFSEHAEGFILLPIYNFSEKKKNYKRKKN